MNIIVAVNSDWGIGLNGTQSIVIPEDRRRFKKLTDNGVVITGRRTFDDFFGLLPNRKNIILTGDRNYKVIGAVIKHSIDDVLAEIADESSEKVFILGGESVYKSFLPLCSHAYVTKIEAAPPSDTFFPNLDKLSNWTVVDEGQTYEHKIYIKTNTDIVRYSFVLYKNNSVYLKGSPA